MDRSRSRSSTIQIRNTSDIPGWVLHVREDVFGTNFSTPAIGFLMFPSISVSLSYYPVSYWVPVLVFDVRGKRCCAYSLTITSGWP